MTCGFAVKTLTRVTREPRSVSKDLGQRGIGPVALGQGRLLRRPGDLDVGFVPPLVVRAEYCTIAAMAKTVPFTEARARLSELLDELEARHEHVVITRNGRPAAVLVPAEEQEVLEETLEVLQDEELLRALRESEDDVKSGRLTSLREVRRELGLG